MEISFFSAPWALSSGVPPLEGGQGQSPAPGSGWIPAVCWVLREEAPHAGRPTPTTRRGGGLQVSFSQISLGLQPPRRTRANWGALTVK